MNVVLPFHPGDQDQAEHLLRWIAELGKVDATVFLMCSDECNLSFMVDLAARAFVAHEWIRDYEKIKSDWSTGDRTKPRSAAGANSLFRQTAWHMYHNKLGPWLWLEPDAIPTSKDWFKQISQAYEAGRRPFMGAKVIGNHSQGNMSGVAVYPQNTPELMDGAMMANHIPFDVVKPMDVNPHCYFTNLIVHQFNAPPFASWEDFNARVPVGTAIYHSCKDGSILGHLGRRLFGRVPDTEFEMESEIDALPGSVEPSPRVTVDEGPAGSTPARVCTPSGLKTEILEGIQKQGPQFEVTPYCAKTRIEQVRALTKALNSLADTPARRTTVLEELKRVKLIPSKLRRR